MKTVLVISSTLGIDDIRIMKQVKTLKRNSYRVIMIGRQTVGENKIENSESIEDLFIIKHSEIDNSKFPYKTVDGSEIIVNNLYLKIILMIFKFVIKYENKIHLKFYKKISKKIKGASNQILIRERFGLEVEELVKEKKISFDIIHCHDFFTLSAGYNLSVRYLKPFIYDAHEYYSDYRSNQFWLDNLWVSYCEKFYLKKRAHIITVSEGIGKLLKKKTKPLSVTIIYNTAPISNQIKKKNIRDEIGLDVETPLIIYIGKFSINNDQGNSLVLEMLIRYQDAHFATVGPRLQVQDNMAVELATKYNVNERFHLFDKVDLSELIHYVSTASAGVYLFKSFNKSLEYSLGNKFFEMSFANIPIIYRSGLKEIDRISKEYEYGYELKNQTAEGLAQALREIHENPSAYRLTNEKLNEFISEYSWEVQEVKLMDLYNQIDRVN